MNQAFRAEKGMPQLNTEFWTAQIFWLILIFSILYLIIWRIFLPKITYSIENRKFKIVDDLNKAQKEIESLSGRLANKNFVDKAPKNVVEECRANLTESEAQVRLVKERLMGLD